MSQQIVVELGLTEKDVVGLIWILGCWLNQYKQHEYSELRTIAEGIKEALEGA